MAEVVGLTLGILSLSAKFLDRPRRALLTALQTLERRSVGDDNHGELPETKRVSGYLAALVPSFRPQIETINRLLLENDDDQLLKFRESYIFDCNMTAFAGAIMGQVALTSLVLPNLSQAHWITRTAFVTSILAGIVSVYAAVVSQKLIAGLTSARQIRAWLTIPLPHNFRLWIRDLEKHLHNMEMLRDYHFARINKDRPEHLGDIEAEEFKASLIPREASSAAVMVLGAPSILLGFSLSMFLLGMGLYLLFVWVRNLDPLTTKDASRDVFIFYAAATLSLLLFFAIPLGIKKGESEKQDLSDRILHRIYMLRRIESTHTRPVYMREDSTRQESLDLSSSFQRLSEALAKAIEVQEAVTKAKQDELRYLGKTHSASAYAIPDR